MQTKAEVPKSPLNMSNNLLFPQGFIFFIFIIDKVIIKLSNDLKKTKEFYVDLLGLKDDIGQNFLFQVIGYTSMKTTKQLAFIWQ